MQKDGDAAVGAAFRAEDTEKRPLTAEDQMIALLQAQLKQKQQECDARAAESEAKTRELEHLKAQAGAEAAATGELRKELQSEKANHRAIKAVFDAQQQSLEDTQAILGTARAEMMRLHDENRTYIHKIVSQEMEFQAVLNQKNQLEAQLLRVHTTLEQLGSVVAGNGCKPPLQLQSSNPGAVLGAESGNGAPDGLHESPIAQHGSNVPFGGPQHMADAPPVHAPYTLPWGNSGNAGAGQPSSFEALAHQLSQGNDGSYSNTVWNQPQLDSRRDMLLHAAQHMLHTNGSHQPPRQLMQSLDASGVLGFLDPGFSGGTAQDAGNSHESAPHMHRDMADHCSLSMMAPPKHEGPLGVPTMPADIPPEGPDAHEAASLLEDQLKASSAAEVQHPKGKGPLDCRRGSHGSDLSSDSFTAKPVGGRGKRAVEREAVPVAAPKELKRLKTGRIPRPSAKGADNSALNTLADMADCFGHDDEDTTPTTAAGTPDAHDAAHHAHHAADGRVAVSKHGRRINPRKGIPMHVMATYALLRLPNNEGNLTDMANKIEENLLFCKQLDWTPRPGTKTYPRWKDALVGCFKPGRYPHLMKTDKKKESLTVYSLLITEIPEKSLLDCGGSVEHTNLAAICPHGTAHAEALVHPSYNSSRIAVKARERNGTL